MKQFINSLMKIILILALSYYSPIKKGFLTYLKDNVSLDSLLYSSNVDFEVNETLLLVENYTDYIAYPNDNLFVSANSKVETAGTIKKVLIYSTHQNEEYLDYGNVLMASKYLADLLENIYDIKVDVIEEDFLATASIYGYNYNKLYSISRMFLEQYLANNTYDLIIDFHRDALPRELTYITYKGKNYAKVMADIGTNNPNHLINLEYAKTLTDKISSYNIPIMKPVYTIASTYNQDLADTIMLIEFGSDQNYYQEVLNSIEIVAKAISEIRW